jgi:hypothetical protein
MCRRSVAPDCSPGSDPDAEVGRSSSRWPYAPPSTARPDRAAVAPSRRVPMCHSRQSSCCLGTPSERPYSWALAPPNGIADRVAEDTRSIDDPRLIGSREVAVPTPVAILRCNSTYGAAGQRRRFLPGGAGSTAACFRSCAEVRGRAGAPMGLGPSIRMSAWMASRRSPAWLSWCRRCRSRHIWRWAVRSSAWLRQTVIAM